MYLLCLNLLKTNIVYCFKIVMFLTIKVAPSKVYIEKYK